MPTLRNELLDFLTRQRVPEAIEGLRNYQKGIKFSDVRYGNLNGKPVKRVCFIIKSRGCGWLAKNSAHEPAGCTICSYPLKTTMGGELSQSEVMKSFREEFCRYDYEDNPIVCLYNSGSFLNNDEIRENVQLNILEQVAQNKHIKQIIIESRAEYIDEEKLAKIKKILGDKELVIGIGLESADDYIREVCINKGLTKNKYEDTLRLINKYFKSLTYILLKPPFINEYTAVTDSVRSIHYAFTAGTRLVSLEACNIQDFSLPYYLEKAGCYRAPWLWSIVEVIDRCFHLGPIFIGGFKITPLPRSAAHNCGKCDARLTDLMDRYNLFKDKRILAKAGCRCKMEWETLMKDKLNSKEDIEQNIGAFLEKAAVLFKRRTKEE